MKSLFGLWLIASLAWAGYILFIYFSQQDAAPGSDSNWIDLLVAVLLPPAMVFLAGSSAARLVRRLQQRA